MSVTERARAGVRGDCRGGTRVSDEDFMYAEHFGLRELPFCNTPDPRYFFATPDHEEAVASLIYGVQERKGFVLLTGEIGAGKTLVSRMMLRHFEDRIASAVIHHSIADAADLLQSIATEFELPTDSLSSAAAMVRRLHDYLLERYAEDKPVVLVLDEAQNLPAAAFEQLRMIGNLEADQAKLLQICFVGQPELQDVIRSRELRQLRQRIFRSFHLPPLSRDLTEAYIAHRLKVAGAEGQGVFDMAALDRIFAHSRGIPRVINTLCDNAMLSAYSAGKTNVDLELIDSVIDFESPRAGRKERIVHAQSASPAAKTASSRDAREAHSDEHQREEIRQLGAQLRRLAEQVDFLRRGNVAIHSAAPQNMGPAGSLESSLRQAEHTLRRIDRTCGALHEGERRVRQLGQAVDGLAVLLAPLAAKLEEITSHASNQLVRVESASAQLESLVASARRQGAGIQDDQDSRLAHPPRHHVSVCQKDQERKRIFAGVAESVANLRRAAQQVGSGLLPT